MSEEGVVLHSSEAKIFSTHELRENVMLNGEMNLTDTITEYVGEVVAWGS